MSDPISHTLSTPELQTALQFAALPPEQASPFATLTPPARIDPVVVSSLQSKNVLSGNKAVSDVWRGVLATLASPTHRLSLFLGSPERWYSIEYFATTSALVGYASIGSEHCITFPCTRANLLRAIGDWLRWKGVPEPAAMRIDLSAEELVALASIADAYREESLRAFLERRQAAPRRFSRDQLLYELQHIASGDPRWFASLLNRHAPSSFMPKPESLDGGIRSLAARDWLKLQDNGVVLEDALTAICGGLSSLNPHVLLGTGMARASGSVVLVMCALHFYWILEFLTGKNRRSWARLQVLGGASLQAFVQRILDAVPKAPAENTDPNAAASDESTELGSIKKRSGSVPGTRARPAVLKKSASPRPPVPGRADVKPATPTAANERQVAAEKTHFRVVLVSGGKRKVEVIREVRALTDSSLRLAVDLVERAPSAIKERVSRKEAAEIKARLEALGATIALQ